MTPQIPGSPVPLASPSAGASAGSTVALASASPAPSPRPTRTPVPTPSLKPGEVITWVKLDRPIFPLGDILVNSFAFVGGSILIALMIGIFLGHLRSKNTDAHGTGSLGLR